MLNEEHWRSLIAAFPTFSQLDATTRRQIRDEGIPTAVAGDQVLFDDGDACSGVLAPYRGRVRVSKLSQDGRELWLYDIHPGEFCVLTVNCLLGRGHYPASGRTVEETEGVLLPGSLFERLFETAPEFRRGVFDMLGIRLTEIMALVEEVAFLRLDARLAGLLLKLAASREAQAEPGVVLATHKDLADDLGCAREVVSRVLESFQKQGWIRLGRKRVEILDSQRLRDVSAGSVT